MERKTYTEFIAPIKEKADPKVLEEQVLIIIWQPRNNIIAINKPAISNRIFLQLLSHEICIIFISNSWLSKSVDPFQPLHQQLLIMQEHDRGKEDCKCSTQAMSRDYELCFRIFTQTFSQDVPNNIVCKGCKVFISLNFLWPPHVIL